MELRQSVIRNIAIPGQTGYEITANPFQVANIFEVRKSGGTPGDLFVIDSDGDVGIGTPTPNNKLEITSDNAAESGLRFTNLTYNTPTSGPSGNCSKVLTVDNDGDVILVDLTDCSTSPKTADIENIERELELLNEKFSKLEKVMASLMIQSSTVIPATQNDAINVRLGSVPVLYQNTPNPFGVNTEISLFLPKSAVNAMIVFHDDFGKVLKEVVVEERGMNKINLDGRDLSSGIYTYSLMIDGDIIDTKRMMKAE
jgi:hypothetical protein